MASGFRLKRFKRPETAWVALSALLALGALAVPSFVDATGVTADQFDWQPALAWQEPWRWWSAALLHLSTGHLVANLAGCSVVGAYGWAARVSLRDTAAWLVAWPLSHLALLAQPALAHYGGLSGVLHAGVAVATFALVARQRGARRAIGVAVAAGLAIKLAAEQPWAGPLQHWAGWDIPIAPGAHLAGVAAGLACAAVAWATSPSPRSQTMAP